ncbi:hypothetical protein ACQKM9_21355 [Viridibacillus sp. NPDC093762]|uniref:hypothetical protein n=1 Tax=Viridibacillus sp. NPDC093762 TaxID=3390720 RepID=UPI003D063145
MVNEEFEIRQGCDAIFNKLAHKIMALDLLTKHMELLDIRGLISLSAVFEESSSGTDNSIISINPLSFLPKLLLAFILSTVSTKFRKKVFKRLPMN